MNLKKENKILKNELVSIDNFLLKKKYYLLEKNSKGNLVGSVLVPRDDTNKFNNFDIEIYDLKDNLNDQYILMMWVVKTNDRDEFFIKDITFHNNRSVLSSSNKGYGQFALKVLEKIAIEINVKSIIGEISSVDTEEPIHKDRLMHFYIKAGYNPKLFSNGCGKISKKLD